MVGKSNPHASAKNYMLILGAAVILLFIGALILINGTQSQLSQQQTLPTSYCHVSMGYTPVLVGNCSNSPPNYVGYFNGYSKQASYILSQTNITINNSFTLAFWFYPLRVGAGVSGVNYSEDLMDINNGSNELPQIYLEWRGNGKFNLNICTINSSFEPNCTEEYKTENWTKKWVQIIETYKNGSFVVYADGSPIFSSAGMVDNNNSNYEWGPAIKGLLIKHTKVYISYYIPYAPGLVDVEYDGYMSNIQIYGSMLNQTEVSTLYAEGIGGLPANLTSLLGWWPLDGNAKDYAFPQYNGTLYGNVSFVHKSGNHGYSFK